MIQGRLAPHDDAEQQKALDAGHDLDRVLTTDDLVTSDNCYFAATGITDGDLLKGVRYHHQRILTESIVMRSSLGDGAHGRGGAPPGEVGPLARGLSDVLRACER